MSPKAEGSATGSRSVVYILLFALALLLPTVHITMFGWIYFMIPAMVLFYMYRWRYGLRFVGAGFILAVAVSPFVSSIAAVIFIAALIPAGYSLAQSGFKGETPALSGFKGVVIMLSCWLLLLGLQTALSGVNPITEFIGSLDHDIEEALNYYRQSDSVAPETMALLEQSFFQMKTVFPKILAAIVISLALTVVWSTMLLGNRLVLKYTGYRPWPDHQNWRLPDKLIWLFIAGALITLVPVSPLRMVGINVLICMSLIYLFQGFAVLSFFLHKWHVPRALRFIIYAMMLFQSFGTVLLLIIGIGDVWLDLRRLKKQAEDKQNNINQ